MKEFTHIKIGRRLELLGMRAILDELPRNLLKWVFEVLFQWKPFTSPRLLTRTHWAPFPREYCSIALNTCDPDSNAASRSKLRPNIENWQRSFFYFLPSLDYFMSLPWLPLLVGALFLRGRRTALGDFRWLSPRSSSEKCRPRNRCGFRLSHSGFQWDAK